MKKQLLNNITILVIFLTFFTNYAQKKLSEKAEISIITSGAGEGLYEKFGHTSIRIIDKENNFDDNYNYGIFDLGESNFYWNFTKGFMKYKLAKYPFFYVLQNSKKDKRWVKEQVLNLTQDEKQEIFNFLENNVKPENSSYFYDPFFDNCATRPRDIILNALKNKFILVDNFSDGKSLRQLMNDKIHQNTWGSVGINLALGSKLDKKLKPLEYLYIPDFLHAMLESSKIQRNTTEEKLIKESKTLLNFDSRIPKSDSISPFLIFSILLIIVSYITYKDFKKNKRTKSVDFLLFFLTGIVGVIIVFLWFFTNHSTAPNNFNFLWGFTPNFIVAFLITKENPPKWVKKHILVNLALLICIPIVWISGIQFFNWTLIPLLFALLVRYSYLQKTLNS